MPIVDRALFGADGPSGGSLLNKIVPGASAAESFISSAMAGLATILGVAFSITIVTLQLTATQYTSRLLRRFLADPMTRGVLGVYIGTIVYLAMVLRATEQPGQGSAGFVPELSVLLAILLFVACIVMLSVFIHHLARSIESGPIVAAVGKDTIHVLRKGNGDARPIQGEPKAPPGSALEVTATAPGYLQLVQEEELLEAAPEGCKVMRVEAHSGQFLLPGRVLLSVWPQEALDDGGVSRLRSCFAQGSERTTHQDSLYGVRQLVDIALKALSPAVNDVHTAVMVVNELGAVCQHLLVETEAPSCAWRELRCDGVVLYAPKLDFRTLMTHAFDEIPRAGMAHPIVIARILEVIAELVRMAPDSATRLISLSTGTRVAEYVEHGSYTASELKLLQKMRLKLTRGTVEHAPTMTNPV